MQQPVGLQQVVYLNLEAVPEEPAELNADGESEGEGADSRNYFKHVSLFKMSPHVVNSGLLARWQRDRAKEREESKEAEQDIRLR